MKKILFISTRNPYSEQFSGDVIRSLKIIKLLKKKNKIDVLYVGKKQKNKTKQQIGYNFDQPNIFSKVFFCLMSFLKLEPMQFGLFYSTKLKKYIDQNANKYDVLFFYHIRSVPYFPKNYKGKTILEMGDLYSKNYNQTFNNLSKINPLAYLYLLESLLIKNIEKKALKTFDKIILFSKKEINETREIYRKNILHIPESVNKIENKFIFTNKNYKILFIGNLGYLPNKLACYDFVKNVLPRILENNSAIEFHIIGKINKLDKFFFTLNPKIKVFGQKDNLKNYINKTICGLANLKIATGVQGKVLTYMSFGLPVICSENTEHNFKSSVIKYKNTKTLVKKILELQKSKKKSLKYSKKSINFIKKFKSNKINLKYLQII